MERSASPGFIPPLSYNLVMLGLHGFLYGLFLALSILSSTALVIRHRRAGLKGSIWLQPLFVGGLALTISVTLHWMLLFTHGVDAILKQTPALYYYQGTPQSIAMIAMVWFCAFSCDLMMIYRLWTMYNGARAIVAFPTLTVTLLLVTGPGLIYELVRLKPGETLYKPSIFKWIPADGVFSMCTNLYCTILISSRVWKASQPMGPETTAISSRLSKRIIPLLSQSAVVYTLAQNNFAEGPQSSSIPHFSTNYLFSGHPLLEIWPSVAGISFFLLSAHLATNWVVDAACPGHATSVNFCHGSQHDGARTIEFGVSNEIIDSIATKERGDTEQGKATMSKAPPESTQV